MLEFQKIEVLFRGLGEHDNPKTSLPGELRRCENAVFPKLGRIDKRRGYSILAVATDTHGEAIDPANLFVNVAIFRGQLLVVGYDTLYSVASRSQSVAEADLVRRGPTLRGNLHVRQVATAPQSGRSV